MSILEQVPREQEDEFTSLGEDGTSLFDDIRPTNQRMRATKAEEFDLPGYEKPELAGRSALVARYKRVSLEEYTLHMRKVTEAAEAKRFDEVVKLYAEFLIDNCEEISKRVEFDAKHPDKGLVPLGVKYDLALADGLRFDASSCLDAVLGVFGDNELQVAEHAEEVFAWMRTGKTADDSEALGKS